MATTRLAIAWVVALLMTPTLVQGEPTPVSFAVDKKDADSAPQAVESAQMKPTQLKPVAWNPAPVADVRALAKPKELPVATTDAAEALKEAMSVGPTTARASTVSSTGQVDPAVTPVSFGVAAASDIEFESTASYCEGDSCVGGDSCSSGGCGSCVSGCGKCCQPANCVRVYGDYLYIQPTDADFNYAIPRDGLAPMGHVGTADPDYQPGFRVGFDVALSRCSSIGASWTWFESQTHDIFSVDAPGNIGALVLQPATTSASSSFLVAETFYDIDFQYIDLAYRGLLTQSSCGHIDYIVGLRYGKLTQDAQVNLSTTGFSPTVVTTNVDFEGLGLQIGLEGDRRVIGGFGVYGRALANFMAGEFSRGLPAGQPVQRRRGPKCPG
ncbi:MAG: Lpg1974 family pore-forming outer membrane protein [Pirellulales bacterium]